MSIPSYPNVETASEQDRDGNEIACVRFSSHAVSPKEAESFRKTLLHFYSKVGKFIVEADETEIPGRMQKRVPLR